MFGIGVCEKIRVDATYQVTAFSAAQLRLLILHLPAGAVCSFCALLIFHNLRHSMFYSIHGGGSFVEYLVSSRSPTFRERTVHSRSLYPTSVN